MSITKRTLTTIHCDDGRACAAPHLRAAFTVSGDSSDRVIKEAKKRHWQVKPNTEARCPDCAAENKDWP